MAERKRQKTTFLLWRKSALTTAGTLIFPCVFHKVDRDRMEMKMRLRDHSDGVYAYELNIPKARAYHDSLVEMKGQLNLNSEITLDLIVGAGEMLKPVEIDRDMEACWPVVKHCVNEALDDLVAMREREGNFIAGDISRRLDLLETDMNRYR